MFESIEKFYTTNHYKLVEDKSNGSLRPGKSFTKDVEICIGKFAEFYKTKGFDKINEERLVSIIGGVDTNTRSQNLRVMREFGFLQELDTVDEEGMSYQLTISFITFIESEITAKEYIYNKLKNISSIDDLSMYLNLLVCTLREAYLYGQVMLFKDSYDKFKADVPELTKRNEYRQRIYDVYGYSGRDKNVTDDVYSPNISYMSRAELENLGLLVMTTQKIDNMNNLVLTKKGYELLLYMNHNMGKILNEGETELNYYTKLQSKFTHNRILFGAPGTGKSFTLNAEKDKLLGKDSKDYERVTFHPDYSYANFVGTYKPIMVKNEDTILSDLDKKDVLSILQDKDKSAQEKYDLLYDKFKDEGLTRLPILLGLYSDENFKTKKLDGSDAAGDNSVERNHGRAIRPYVSLVTDMKPSKEIAYEYVPGPFMSILVKALKSGMTDSPKPFLLIIEEINRANIAAVFGDVFQLLDRDNSNVSEYAISTTNDMRSYLAQEFNVDESLVETIKIPDNLFIWATMNSADQGVFPMDTAFKRRWDFTYLGIDDAVDDISESIKNRKYTLGKGKSSRLVNWNDLRSAINDVLSSETYNINEDKLLGPYFVSKAVLENENDEEFIKVFKNKVLMYLFDDAAKQKKKTFFEKCKDDVKGIRYSDICKQFDTKGVFIFPEEVSKRFTDKPTGADEVEADAE